MSPEQCSDNTFTYFCLTIVAVFAVGHMLAATIILFSGWPLVHPWIWLQ